MKVNIPLVIRPGLMVERVDRIVAPVDPDRIVDRIADLRGLSLSGPCRYREAS